MRRRRTGRGAFSRCRRGFEPRFANPRVPGRQVDGVDYAVLSDQVKSLDWKVRRAKMKATVSQDVLLHVRAKMKALLQIA